MFNKQRIILIACRRASFCWMHNQYPSSFPALCLTAVAVVAARSLFKTQKSARLKKLWSKLEPAKFATQGAITGKIMLNAKLAKLSDSIEAVQTAQTWRWFAFLTVESSWLKGRIGEQLGSYLWWFRLIKITAEQGKFAMIFFSHFDVVKFS